MCIHIITTFSCGHSSIDFSPTTSHCGLGSSICSANSQALPLKERENVACDECYWAGRDPKALLEMRAECLRIDSAFDAEAEKKKEVEVIIDRVVGNDWDSFFFSTDL